MTTTYGNKIIVTRTSRNGRRLSFMAFDSLDEMAKAIINNIELDFDPDTDGDMTSEISRAMREMHQGRYIGFGGQWIWERVTNDQELTFWESVRAPYLRGLKSGWYRCTPVPARWVGLDDYAAAHKQQPLPVDVLHQLPPRARFLSQLKVTLWTRIPSDSDDHFNGYLTRVEASELQRLDLYQPGHSQYRFSTPNEDLSDFAQKDTLGRYHHEREQDASESPQRNGGAK